MFKFMRFGAMVMVILGFSLLPVLSVGHAQTTTTTPIFGDGRLNDHHSFIVYCSPEEAGGVEVWRWFDNSISGTRALNVIGSPIATSILFAAATGQSQLVTTENGIQLWAINNGLSLQAHASNWDGYGHDFDFIFDSAICAPYSLSATSTSTATATTTTNSTSSLPGTSSGDNGSSQYATGTFNATTNTYTIAPGDHLFRIALRFNLSLTALQTANNIADVDIIYAGTTLTIP